MDDSKNFKNTEEGENSRKKAVVWLFGHELPKKKAIIVACAFVLSLVLIGSVCLAVAMHSQKPEKTNPSDINTNETIGDDKTESSQETSEESTSESAAPTSSDTTSGEHQTSDDENGGRSSAPSSNNSDSDKPDSKPSGESGSDNSAESSEQQSSTPQHTHNWVPVTKTVHHDAQYKTVHHDAVYEERSICNNCGKDITGQTTQHMKDSLLSGGQCGSYHSELVQTQAAWDEQVLVKAAWDETVTTGYRCSVCGAAK